ncbi:hypothetical protein IJG22_01245 [Candidatus Saccharibacteria bacterium]|nr:hypothetical protein [Candidatus Saccharibacteria bacterium]
MKYKDVYENCKRLVSYGETSGRSSISEHEVYVDSFGCDLQIYRSDILYRGIGEMRESMYVYFGGREVYYFNEDNPDWEFIVKGYWEKLVVELWRYEIAVYLEETYNVNGTLLELSRRESAMNREKFNKYCGLCVSFVKRNGIKTESEASRYYKFIDQIDGYKIEVYLREMTPREKKDYCDCIELYFDKKIVFRFNYNCSNIGGIFDEKGKYTPGEWERIIEELAKNS